MAHAHVFFPDLCRILIHCALSTLSTNFSVAIVYPKMELEIVALFLISSAVYVQKHVCLIFYHTLYVRRRINISASAVLCCHL